MIPNFQFERLALVYKILYYLGATLDMGSGCSNWDSSCYFSVRL